MKYKKKINRFYKFHIVTPRVAHSAYQELNEQGGRGLFLDCGSNIGQGFKFFSRYFKNDKFDYELFEPNPNCLPFLKKIKDSLPACNIVIHDKAIGVSNETLKFYGLTESKGGGNLSQGGSILSDHNSKMYVADSENAIYVQSIDFCEFIKVKLEDYKLVVIKMDIEGGEYPLLDRMIKENIFLNIHSIFCEFHSQYMIEEKQESYRSKEIEYESKIKKSNCKFNLWI